MAEREGGRRGKEEVERKGRGTQASTTTSPLTQWCGTEWGLSCRTTSTWREVRRAAGDGGKGEEGYNPTQYWVCSTTTISCHAHPPRVVLLPYRATPTLESDHHPPARVNAANAPTLTRSRASPDSHTTPSPLVLNFTLEHPSPALICPMSFPVRPLPSRRLALAPLAFLAVALLLLAAAANGQLSSSATVSLNFTSSSPVACPAICRIAEVCPSPPPSDPCWCCSTYSTNSSPHLAPALLLTLIPTLLLAITR